MASSKGGASEGERMTAVPAAVRLQTILIWSIALLAALFLVWPVWRAFFPMEIWGNEGWNAYHADAAMRGAAQLYPPSDGLVANNYPPLSYYVMGWLGRAFGDPLYAGRAVSIRSEERRVGKECRSRWS